MSTQQRPQKDAAAVQRMQARGVGAGAALNAQSLLPRVTQIGRARWRPAAQLCIYAHLVRAALWPPSQLRSTLCLTGVG
jgi:hypothetical protein